MSLEKSDETLKKFNIDISKLIGREISGYKIIKYLGCGTKGIVFLGKNKYDFEIAMKLIPFKNLDNEWSKELIKLQKLDKKQGIARYKLHELMLIDGKGSQEQCLLIGYDFVPGIDLKKYLEIHRDTITIQFVQEFLEQLLDVFQAMKINDITHGDLHRGNIMVAEPYEGDLNPRKKFIVTDFAQGGPTRRARPKEDYLQVALTANDMLDKYIKPEKLDGKDRYIYDNLINILNKEFIEDDPTVGSYVKNPRELITLIKNLEINYRNVQQTYLELKKPFDFLSCEQIGDSYKLMNELYSDKFPGGSNLFEKITTIVTGPRGCGKTTIFRNMSLKTLLLAEQDKLINEITFIGIYYNCKDLYFAFPYEVKKITKTIRKQITHYVNMALTYELLDTLDIANDNDYIISDDTICDLEEYIKNWFSNFEPIPSKNNRISHIKTFIYKEKQNFRNILSNDDAYIPDKQTPEHFLLEICTILQKYNDWLKKKPFFFFLDDYSIPKISQNVQKIVNCFIFTRYSELFFKISTESIVSIESTDAMGKVLEPGREYNIIDFGDYFLNTDPELRNEYLKEIVNKRLSLAKEFIWDEKDITKILSPPLYKSYNELALLIAREKKKGKYYYGGWNLIVDLCSGDIAHILGLIRDIFIRANNELIKEEIPIEIQDSEIKKSGTTFLTRLEAVPKYGKKMKLIATSFGNVANYYLKTKTSKNEKAYPRHQAFRIEIYNELSFDKNNEDIKLEEVYNNLIRYGVFIRDVKGKSQRGAVVPRLYLRRLLIPLFLLTPNSRDSIRVTSDRFKLLLKSPTKFESIMKNKKHKKNILKYDEDKKQIKLKFK